MLPPVCISWETIAVIVYVILIANRMHGFDLFFFEFAFAVNVERDGHMRERTTHFIHNGKSTDENLCENGVTCDPALCLCLRIEKVASPDVHGDIKMMLHQPYGA